MRILNLLAHRGVIAVVTRGVALGSMLFVNAVLSRVLSAHEFGVYLVIWSVSTTVALVGQFGLKSSVVKVIAELIHENRKEEVLAVSVISISVSISLSLVAGIITFAVVPHIFGITASEGGVTQILALLISVLLSANLVAPEILRATLYTRAANVVGNALTNSVMATLVLLLSLFVAHTDLNIALGAMALSLVVGILANIAIFCSSPYFGRWAPSIPVTTLIMTSVPFVTSHVGSFVMLNGDLWVASASFGSAAGGAYGAASRLALLVGIPAQIGISVVIGQIAHLAAAGKKSDIEGVARQAANLFALTGGAIALPFIAFNSAIMALVYGAPFAEAGTLLAILSVGQFASTVGGPAQSVMLMSGGQRVVMTLTIAFAALNFLTASALSQSFGIVGIAIAYALGLCGYTIALIVSARVVLGIWTIPTMRPGRYKLK